MGAFVPFDADVYVPHFYVLARHNHSSVPAVCSTHVVFVRWFVVAAVIAVCLLRCLVWQHGANCVNAQQSGPRLPRASPAGSGVVWS